MLCVIGLLNEFIKSFRGKKIFPFTPEGILQLLFCFYHNTPLTTIKEILGHTNIRTTETYADINEATIYNSISKIRFRELEKAEKKNSPNFFFQKLIIYRQFQQYYYSEFQYKFHRYLLSWKTGRWWI